MEGELYLQAAEFTKIGLAFGIYLVAFLVLLCPYFTSYHRRYRCKEKWSPAFLARGLFNYSQHWSIAAHCCSPPQEQSCYARENRFHFPQKASGLLHVCVEYVSWEVPCFSGLDCWHHANSYGLTCLWM